MHILNCAQIHLCYDFIFFIFKGSKPMLYVGIGMKDVVYFVIILVAINTILTLFLHFSEYRSFNNLFHLINDSLFFKRIFNWQSSSFQSSIWHLNLYLKDPTMRYTSSWSLTTKPCCVSMQTIFRKTNASTAKCFQ